jgi:hypothetical protein
MTNPVIDAHGNQRWFVNVELHRVDGPAVIYTDGDQSWWVNGKLHRTDGPAYTGADGTQQWFVNNRRHYSSKSYQEAAKLSDEDMLALTLKHGVVGLNY